MKTPSKIAVALGSLTLLAAGLAQAAPTISAVPGTSYNLNGTVTSLATGSTMGGMGVTVCFDQAQTDCQTRSWVNGTSGSGSATGTYLGNTWILSVDGGQDSGDTFESPFLLQHTAGTGAIWGFSLFGLGGLTAFDLTNPSPGTDGSLAGRSFELLTGPLAFTVSEVTYSDQLSLNGAPAVGDLFLRMSVVFGTGLMAGESLEFLADTDSLSGTITSGTGPTPVSAPGTLALAGLALLALGAGRRRVRASA